MRLTSMLMLAGLLAGLFFCVIVSYVLMSERQGVVPHHLDKQLAYIQNHVLKIVPFVPQKRPR